MGRRAGSGLPAVLAVPLLADRLAMELGLAADEVATLDESPAGRERAAFLASASAQVGAYGTAAMAEPDPEPVQLRPAEADDDLETRTG